MLGSEARSLRQSDIAGVAQLFQQRFRDPGKPASAQLGAYLEEVFLNHPWQDSEQTSKVVVDGDGKVQGFVGVFPQRYLHKDNVVRTSVLGTLMSSDPGRNPLVGAKLLRSALSGSQELSISESANPLSLKMWEKSGGATLPLFSLSWLRVLKPVALSLAMLSERHPIFSNAAPLANGLDSLARRFGPDFLSIAADGPQGKDDGVGPDEFAAAIPALSTRYDIRPQWDKTILTWLLQHAESKSAYGPVMMRLVKDRKGRTVGGYIYYGKPRGAAFVLQFFAEPGAERLVVDNLLAHANTSGFAAVRGRLQPEFLDALVRQKSMLFRRSATVIHTRSASLQAAFAGPNALITGLAAEAWTKLIGEEFS
jgi:hypothetical protein